MGLCQWHLGDHQKKLSIPDRRDHELSSKPEAITNSAQKI